MTEIKRQDQLPDNTGDVSELTTPRPTTDFFQQLSAINTLSDKPVPQSANPTEKEILAKATSQGISVIFKIFQRELQKSPSGLGLATGWKSDSELVWISGDEVKQEIMNSQSADDAALMMKKFTKPLWDLAIKEGVEIGKLRSDRWYRTVKNHQEIVTSHFSTGAGTARDFFWRYTAALYESVQTNLQSDLNLETLTNITNNSLPAITKIAGMNIRTFLSLERKLFYNPSNPLLSGIHFHLAQSKAGYIFIPNTDSLSAVLTEEQNTQSLAPLNASAARRITPPRTGCPAMKAKATETGGSVLVDHLNFQVRLAKEVFFPALLKRAAS